MYAKTLYAGWSDMDFNSHMKNTAYLDKSSDVRMMFYADHGLAMGDFVRLRVGPVVMKDEVEYFKEVGLMQELRVTLALAGMSEDGSRFQLRNEIQRTDGKLCARVTSTGGWLDLAARKLVVPPAELLRAMQAMPKAEGFVVMPSSMRSGSA